MVGQWKRIWLAGALTLCSVGVSKAAYAGSSVLQPRPNHSAPILAQSVSGSTDSILRVPGGPSALVDDPTLRRLFAIVTNFDTNEGGVVTIDTSDNRQLAFTRLGIMLQGGGNPTNNPGAALPPGPGSIALDEHTKRVFVLSSGPTPPNSSDPVGRGRVYMLDAITGRLLRTLTVNYGPLALVPDQQNNRVYVGYGGANVMDVLDGNTGRVVRTVSFTSSSPDEGPVIPLGVDGRANRVVVATQDDVVVVDGRTRKQIRHIATTGTVLSGVVDAARGRAILAEQGIPPDDDSYVETVNIATGKVLSSLDDSQIARQVMAVDNRTGQTLILETAAPASGYVAYPSDMLIIDDKTGKADAQVAISPYGAAPGAAATTVIDPLTGHALLAYQDDPLGSDPAHVDVLDVRKGRELKSVTVGHVGTGSPGIVVDPSSHHAFVANTYDSTIEVLDARRL